MTDIRKLLPKCESCVHFTDKESERCYGVATAFDFGDSVMLRHGTVFPWEQACGLYINKHSLENLQEYLKRVRRDKGVREHG